MEAQPDQAELAGVLSATDASPSGRGETGSGGTARVLARSEFDGFPNTASHVGFLARAALTPTSSSDGPLPVWFENYERI